MHDSSSHRRAFAFSLIELLVVVGVLALLAGLFLPALSRAKGRARDAICLNRVRQMVLVWNLYADDEDEHVPGARTWEVAPGMWQPDWTHGSWMNLASPSDASNWDANSTLKQSVLWPYFGGELDLWKCPADRSTAITARGETIPRIRSYSMNCWVGGPGWDASGAWRPLDPHGWQVFLKRTEMLNPGPARTWVFLDERADSINDGCFIVDMAGYPNGPGQWKLVDFPSSNHRGAGVLAFADGHACFRRWMDPRTNPPSVANQDLQQNIDSPENVDVLWLQERSTRWSGD